MPGSLTAYELLLEIDQRCRSLAAGLVPAQAQDNSWSGIGFRIGEHTCVAPIAEIAEILHEPRFTALPGVKPWVRGVANLRGQLLPIMDLCGFFAIDSSLVHKQRRVLVLEYKDVFVGLQVDEVLGMQHFAQADPDANAQVLPPALLAPYVKGHFTGETTWWVFSPFALAQAPQFWAVAV
ncbi:chemotaxis protein CheW [Pseudomonas helleri]|uniref:Chemotaxis protein CheW n=1 Tax=Pseudomonas helleri TaxID=1608996 RepID=A0A6A7Z490_9PSED|nr:chemotaxis protein CheW [Pseudomonas helleri]MQT27020.1 chemotaxis protein CheW [Pseudomonas helleri]MQT82486.1 chemotaxis protein CheW [Pseudomonas helleri]MQU17194.1 chemotaxis protein CheW [Pseudomonas helleri]MQU27962.1 chemotaxis protein CheW [Pseudomonas helleri]